MGIRWGQHRSQQSQKARLSEGYFVYLDKIGLTVSDNWFKRDITVSTFRFRELECKRTGLSGDQTKWVSSLASLFWYPLSGKGDAKVGLIDQSPINKKSKWLKEKSEGLIIKEIVYRKIYVLVNTPFRMACYFCRHSACHYSSMNIPSDTLLRRRRDI